MPKTNLFERMTGKSMDHRLLELFQELEKLVAEYPNYQRNVEIWLRHRRETILALQDATNKLDRTHRNANVAQCAGGGLTVLGALVEIFCAIMDLNNRNSTPRVRKVGRICGGVGITTSAVASGIEGGLSMVKIYQLKKMLLEDEAILRKIAPFFDRSKKVDSALKEIFHIGLAPQFQVLGRVAIVTILKVFTDTYVCIEDVKRAFANVAYDINSRDFQYFVEVTLPKLFNTFQEIFSDERLRDSLKSISKLLTGACFVIGSAQLCLDVTSSLSGVNITKKLSQSLITRLNISPALVPWCSAIAVSLTQSVVISYQVVSIIDTIDNIVNDAPSVYSKALRDLSEQMSVELRQIADNRLFKALE